MKRDDTQRADAPHAKANDKQYDRAYFDRWYRSPRERVVTQDSLERKVHLALSVAEYLLGRRVRSVLDVGCGEALWRGVLRRLRPGVRYVGVDSSDYALARYGRTRDIRRGSVGTLERVRPALPRRADLIVCADVLQYVDEADLVRGLASIARRLGGVAYIDAYTSEDFMVGDREGWLERSAATYRQLFARAGLVQCGPYCYVRRDFADDLNQFERLTI